MSKSRNEIIDEVIELIQAEIDKQDYRIDTLWVLEDLLEATKKLKN